MAGTRAAVMKLAVVLVAMSQLVHMATPTADPTTESSLLVTSVSPSGGVNPQPSHGIRAVKVLLDAAKPSIPVPPPPPHLILPCKGRTC
ncbi:hypothetical protein CFC21_031963 [Triticum aestivum]|uniref:Uncharacterized protein n=4 Tax=Triticinae TaxID=1648030 RepID=A0A453D345_AEGTS|nr:uncharacterized protein LOC109761899 [Aegilops tauschii subsp. strangulata]XP_044328960.1 uncharacterized protein LOC123050199 [Triticum aestivum]KAF7018707.1 hypothetical protein CFC21_031963 [Triticum aestivum]